MDYKAAVELVCSSFRVTREFVQCEGIRAGAKETLVPHHPSPSPCRCVQVGSPLEGPPQLPRVAEEGLGRTT